MKRMITRMALLSVVAFSSAAVSAQETESVSFGRTIWNNFNQELSRLKMLLVEQPAHNPESPVVFEGAASAHVAPVVEIAPAAEIAPVVVTAPAADVAQVKAPHFIKRTAQAFVAGAKKGSTKVTSSIALVGNKLSSGFNSTRSYMKAHPVKVAAYITSALTISGLAGYGIYTYTQQNTEAAQN